jgi:hypothetical protein
MPLFAMWLAGIQPGVWAIWGVILFLTILVARRPLGSGVPLPPNGASVHVITATGTPPASTSGIVMMVFFLVCFGAAMFVLAHNALHGGLAAAALRQHHVRA